MERTEPFLLESLRDMKPVPAVDVESRETNIRSSMQVRRLIISEARFERWSGDRVARSRYEVLEGGEDYVLIRHYPDDEPRYNDMTFQEIVNTFKGNVKSIPMCMGIEFLDEDHFRTFRVKVENGKVIHGQPNIEVYERSADLTP